MTRVVLGVVAVLAVPAAARAEILPTFSMGACEVNASHVVVVNAAGKVLDSWRGDLKPGDALPVAEFHHKPIPPLNRFGKKEGVPQKVLGERMILFLKRGLPKYGRGQVVGSWSPANWIGEFNVSVLWIEKGHAFALEQFINPGPQELAFHATEAEVKKQVEKIDRTVRDLLAKARAEKDLPERAKILADIVTRYPGFAPAALAGLEWSGADAVPVLRNLVHAEHSPSIGQQELLCAYSALGKIGEPARDVLMKHLADQLRSWKELSEKVSNWKNLDENEEQLYRQLFAGTEHPDAFRGLSAEQQTTVRDLRDLWGSHDVLSKLGEKGDRVVDRLNRILAHQGR